MRGDELASSIEVEESKDSELVRLTVTASTAEQAQQLANGLIDTAVRYFGEVLSRPATESLDFISNQLAETQQELAAAQQQLRQFQVEHRMGDLDSEIASLQVLIRSLRFERDQAEVGSDREKVSNYTRLISERETELLDLLQLGTEYNELKSNVARSESLINLLLDKRTEATLKENESRKTGFVQIVEPARAPNHPNSPFDLKITIVGAVTSLIVGIFLAFVLEYVERLRVFVPAEKVTAKASR